MTTYSSEDVGFALVDGFSIASYLTDFEDFGPEHLSEDVCPMGAAAWYAKPLGIIRAKLTQNGLFDDTALGIHAALTGKRGTAMEMLFAPMTNAIGKKSIGMPLTQLTYNPVLKEGGLTRCKATYSGKAWDEGVILHALGAETATNAETGVDNGAETTVGGVFSVQVTAVTLDGATVTVSLDDSADNSNWLALAGATKTVTATGGFRIEVAGTIRQFVRAVTTVTDAGAGTTLTYASALTRN